ncbi:MULTISPECIES: LysR family transcriptional regulator [unclassified Streptomyces]|uniref:helix-turn-helix domain-containing protein n=1 Tax=unclassified Streptomyces TaxID=2593676 RepID=UPI002F915364
MEIFLTLAQELHFGRTAEQLHVSPARVSQAIKKQERRIGGEHSSTAPATTSTSPRSASSSTTTCSPCTAACSRAWSGPCCPRRGRPRYCAWA